MFVLTMAWLTCAAAFSPVPPDGEEWRLLDEDDGDDDDDDDYGKHWFHELTPY